MKEDLQSGFCIFGTRFSAPSLAPGLYVVATPIGNLKDITIRALQTLAAADFVLCEDTRQSARLLDHYLIKAKKIALHEHNERAKIPGLIKKLQVGAAIALISDAGTPLLSDPGFPLVRAAREANIAVFTLPGPSALLGALATAGIATDRFTFIGFLPVKKMARQTALTDISQRPETLIFYESARRLNAVIDAMTEIFGPDRLASVSLELTKKFERTHSGNLGELAQQLAHKPARGEVVIIVTGAKQQSLSKDLWLGELKEALAQKTVRSAVDEIAAKYKLRRKQVYDEALKLKP